MSNDAEVLSAADVLGLIEKAEWRRLENGHSSGFCGSTSIILVGNVDGSTAQLTQKYCEDGPGAEAHFYYYASIYRNGARIGHLGVCYSNDPSDDPYQLRELFERHKSNFTTRMTKEVRENTTSR